MGWHKFVWVGDERILPEYVEFETLKGKVLTKVTIVDDEAIIFESEDGERYFMFHDQECCESVMIEDICGDINCLLNTPITIAELVTERSCSDDDWGDGYTWSFYKLATVKGYVTIRWYGTSNGYYSEEVDFVKQVKEKV